MKVLQVVPRLDVGGVETGTLDLAKRLKAQGHQAFVISSGGKLVEKLTACGAKHYMLAVDRKSIFTVVSCVFKVRDIIRQENIDVVHAASRVPAWICFFACRMSGAPLVTSCHGYYNRRFFSRAMGWGKFVIVISKFIGRHMASSFGVPLSRIRLVHRGIDIENYDFKKPQKRPSGDYIIAVIARLTPLKGHEDFIKAFSIVARKMPKVRAWIIGDAPKGKEAHKRRLKWLVENLGISSNVEFLGNRSDVPGLLAKVDLIVLPTVAQEGFGRVLVEAAAAGVPVVATNVGGVSEIVEDGRTGMLVPVGEPGRMADAMQELLNDRDKAAVYAENARQKAQSEFNLEKMVDATIDVYAQAVAHKRILVIKLSALGDVILATPSLKAIKERFRDSFVAVLTTRSSSQVLNRCPYIDEMIILDTKKEKSGPARLWKVSAQLRRYGFDMAIDLQNNTKSHILAFLSLAPKRYGYDNGKFSFLLNKKVGDPKLAVPPVKHQFRILGLLGIKEDNDMLELWPSEDEQQYIDELFSKEQVRDHQVLIGVNLGSSKKWLSKRWPLENMVKLSDRLAERLDARTVVTGSREDEELARKFAEKTKHKPILATGKTNVMQLAALIDRCSVYVTSDSAPLHIAAAVRTPFVAIFGPTDPERHMPPAQKFVLIDKNLGCSPCYKSKCAKNTCMREISVEEVYSAIEDLKGRA